MQSQSLSKCLILANAIHAREIDSALADFYDTQIIVQNLFDPVAMLNTETYCCVIIYLKADTVETWYSTLIASKVRFAHVPFISIIHDYDLEAARLCGRIGFEKVIERGRIGRLHEIVSTTVSKSSTKILLKNFGIDEGLYSYPLRKCLQIIEQDYICIQSTSVISNAIGFSESALSRLFKNHKLIGPKRLLLLFKVKHAMVILLSTSLSMLEVALSSGFSCEKNFFECFQRVAGLTPTKFRARFSSNPENQPAFEEEESFSIYRK